MFNAGYKKEAIADLQRVNNKYKYKYELTMSAIVNLHESRIIAVDLIKRIEAFVNSIANKPKEFDKLIGKIRINYQKFEGEIQDLELESKKVNKVSGSVAGAGLAAGAGVAAFAPSAAMAIATTFGAASTGTLISTLSGAAATNAALAWIGGGALAVGGGGMAAGNAFLAMSGPVGWAIGGTALVGGGLLANSKNKKVAEKAERQIREIKKEIEKLSEIIIKVGIFKKEVNEMQEHLDVLLKHLLNSGVRDYKMFNDIQLDNLKTLLNITLSLSSKLSEKVN